MATEAVRYVDPNASAGGNGTEQILTGINCAYTSLSAWEAARQRDLTSGDEIEHVYCTSNLDAGSGNEDTTALTIDGWVTSGTDYIIVEAWSSHGGKWNNNIYRRTTTSTGVNFDFYDSSNIFAVGIQISLDGGTGDSQVGMGMGGGNSTNNRISKCIIKSTSGTGTVQKTGIEIYNLGGAIYIYNCICYDILSSGSYSGGIFLTYTSTTATSYSYNNTLHTNTVGIGQRNTLQPGYIKNCLFRSCTTAASGTYDSGSGYNATDNASMGYSGGGTGDRTSQTFYFVDETNDNFHLRVEDGGARNYGADNPSSGMYLDDIDGQTRISPWDIGADEVSSIGKRAPLPLFLPTTLY